MTFQAWKMVLLNSMTFHDFPGRVVTLYSVHNAVCEASPVQHQTYGYLPSHTALPPGDPWPVLTSYQDEGRRLSWPG